MDSLETKTQWANYFAEVLRLKWPEASTWLKQTHGTTDLTDQIKEKLASLDKTE